MSSASQSSYHVAMSSSPSPPTNIGSYARIMHQHTKRQMEAASQSTRRRSSQGSNDSSTNQSASGPTERSLSQEACEDFAVRDIQVRKGVDKHIHF
ncbi:hypothetical protein B0T19DRAFT_441607 [Cercophora scortea]|uniref:Uncharacterized protein n=1 Tax=Cercophora scortea TaxID=314031 RepID=A0AAE0MCN2_9PEZI|nr:hypothetical protein B0T19DRAFT_441607 [Cercophora scortea]